MKFNIIYENEDFLILDKPHGQEFHGDKGILNELRIIRPSSYGIHRLDKATSGLMIFAKNKETQKEISKLFEEKLVRKSYVALSQLKPKKKQGLIKGDLEKSRNGSYKLLRSFNNPSITKFTSHYNEDQDIRVYLLYPRTGKTHQLRVVMKSLGSPILGDIRYGSQTADRMYLHATVIDFEFKSRSYSFNSVPSKGELFERKDMKDFIKSLLNYKEETGQ